MKRNYYTQKDSSIVYIWALVLPIIFMFVLSVFLATSPKDESGNFIVLSQTWFSCFLRVCSAAILIGLFFVFNKKNNISFKACGITKKSNYLNAIICAVLGIGFCLLSNDFITLIACGLDQIGLYKNASINIPLTNFGYYILAILLVCVFPAVTEELVYRGMIFNGLKQKGKWPAILLSSLAFCLMHASIPQFPSTFMLGIVLGYIMWETGALWLCMILHFCNNASVITAMYISAQTTGSDSSGLPATIDTSFVLTSIGLFVLAVGLVVLGLFLIKLIKKKYHKKEQEQTQELSEKSDETSVLLETKTENKQSPKTKLAVNPLLETKKTNIILILGYALAILLTVVNYL